jgi:hypothetical protein
MAQDSARIAIEAPFAKNLSYRIASFFLFPPKDSSPNVRNNPQS